MSVAEYSVKWSEQLISRVEAHLNDVHDAVHSFFKKKGYKTKVSERIDNASAESHGLENGECEENAEKNPVVTETRPVDVVSPAGSFLLRSCSHSSPFPEAHAEQGVGADLVITIPDTACSIRDIQEGLYLEKRQQFLDEVHSHLITIARESKNAMKQQNPSQTDSVAERMSYMYVTQKPFGSCYGNCEKNILHIRFQRKTIAPESVESSYNSISSTSCQWEVFYINVHARCLTPTGRVASLSSIRKHPLYSYLVLEDFLMPQYLKKLHAMVLGSTTLLRSLVLLRCWAYHTGIMSACSGHPEALNGFILSAMVLKLLEDGIISPNMPEENIVRAVWVNIVRDYFTPGPVSSASRLPQGSRLPAEEENGEVAILKLSGHSMNILFRTTKIFFNNIIKPAAEEALLHSRTVDFFSTTPFQPLPVRLDVTLCVTKLSLPEQCMPKECRDSKKVKQAIYFNAQRAEVSAVEKIIHEALDGRQQFVTAWRKSADELTIGIKLTTEADARSRLTRGPILEEAEKVLHFNKFWGEDVSSTRQLPDGRIHRCVLWSFPEDAYSKTPLVLSASVVTRRIAEFALRKHFDRDANVSVFLSSLDGFLKEKIGSGWHDGLFYAQESLREAIAEVSNMITRIPRTSLPCKITSFDVVSPSERSTEVFPVRPHLALTYTSDDLGNPPYLGINCAPTIEPIHCVLSFDDKHKIPDTLEAISLMKGAICAQLSCAVQKLFSSEKVNSSSRVQSFCSTQSVDIILKGYLFRIYVAHYREVSLLKALQRDSDAILLEQKLFWSVQHAKFMRTIAVGHQSYPLAVRLSKRWISAMLLSEFILPEVVELLVANAYLQTRNTPKQGVTGFIRFLELLATYDWTNPLVLPFTDEGKDAETAANLLRKLQDHQGMYIAAPYAPTASPFTFQTPRPMIVHRLVQLAKASLSLLLRILNPVNCLPEMTDPELLEKAIFLSDPSVFDFSMELHPQIVLQPDRALWQEILPTEKIEIIGSAKNSNISLCRIWQMDEFGTEKDDDEKIKNARKEYIFQLVEREPAAHAVRIIRSALKDRAMVFYDALGPKKIFVVSVTGKKLASVSCTLHEEILRRSKGAILPAPQNELGAVKSRNMDGIAPIAKKNSSTLGNNPIVTEKIVTKEFQKGTKKSRKRSFPENESDLSVPRDDLDKKVARRSETKETTAQSLVDSPVSKGLKKSQKNSVHKIKTAKAKGK